MRKIWEFIKAGLAVLFWAVVFEILHHFKLYPETWVAELVVSAPTVLQQTIFLWSFILLLSAALLFIEHWLPPSFHFWRRSSIQVPTPIADKIVQSLADPVFVSMREATTRLYESPAKVGEMRLSVASERLGTINGAASPNERLDWLAHFISQKLSVYGRKPPARDVKKIDDIEIRRATFTDGATILRDNAYDQTIYWVDLCVRSVDFTQLVSSLTRIEADEPDKFIPIHKAISHVAGIVGDKNNNERDPCFPDTRTALRQAAAIGKLRMRGCRQLDRPGDYQSFFSDVQTDIPSDYWKTAVIGPIAIDEEFTGTGHTMPEVANDWGQDWTKAKKQVANLSVNWNDLIRLWPERFGTH